MSDLLPYPPELCLLVDDPPEGDEWIHEVKFDGIRVLAVVNGQDIRLVTRNAKDWTSRFPDVAEALTGLKLRDSVLDGEVAVDIGGKTSFGALPRVHAGSSMKGLKFFLFDMLRHNGKDIRSEPLLSRKAALSKILGRGKHPVLAYTEHVQGQGAEFLAEACAAGLEGIISKRADAPYSGGRGRNWQKSKCVHEQEFVVGGFTEPAGTRRGLGALLIGTFEGGRLVYRGKVGTGFSEAVLVELRDRLDRIERKESPFEDVPRLVARTAHWVKPELVAEIRYTEVTEEGRLRHPAFTGIRDDKPASDVKLEVPAGSKQNRTRMAPAKKKTTRSTVRKSQSRKAGGRAASRKMTKSRTTTATRPHRARSTSDTKPRNASIPAVPDNVRLTSPDKLLFPADGITKLDLAGHYAGVADRMLPHLRGRPLTLVRCPSGYEEGCFFQKHLDDSAPSSIRRVKIREKAGMSTYGVVDDLDGLLSLVQVGALEIHTSNARADSLEKPDRLLIDLDPPEGLDWERIAEAAIDVRDAFADLGLQSFVRTTGGKGLHVVVPVSRRAGWDELKEFSRAVASLLVDMRPDRYTTEMPKQKRKGRVLLDYLRNTRGATAIESYSTRARKGAPVATPIAWDELHDVRSDTFTVLNIRDRLKSLSQDPWKDMAATRQSVTAAMRRKVGL